MLPYLDPLLEMMQKLLGQMGVAKASQPFWALVSLYLLLTALVLLVVMFVWWRNQRQISIDSSVDQSAPVGMVESSDVENEQLAHGGVEGSGPKAIESAEGLIRTVRSGLQKTRSSLVSRLESLFRRATFSTEMLEELEEILVTSDFGMSTTLSLVNSLEQQFSGKDASPEDVYTALKEEIVNRLKAVEAPVETSSETLHVVMVVGVNGVGKTTTIGKLACTYRDAGMSVLLAAGDTFRAAAAEQLSIWAERSGADIVRHTEGGDPAAVTFDGVRAAIARKSDVLIVDTAGRLHTKTNLMEELKKVRRVLGSEIPGAPHQTLLVVDATTGQNALVQAKMFQESVQIDGLVLTKLDGTAKGGIIVAICSELSIPVRYVGVGEGLHDLRPFDAREYADALFVNDEVA